jgi:branched-chain amino acid transport system permease protein
VIEQRAGWNAVTGKLSIAPSGKTFTTAAWVVCIVVLISAPAWAGAYWLRVVTGILMVAILSSSWNIVAGICGYFSFGNVVFFGLGAYTTAVLMSVLNVPFPITVLLGGFVAIVFAILVGLAVLRLKGHYFAIATLGINLAMREVVTNMEWTGGGQGIWLQIPNMEPRTFSLLIFYMMLALLGLTVITVYLLMRSRWGYAMRAIRGNEEAAAVLGIQTTYYKVAAFALSGVFSGMAGSIYAYWFTYIEPGQVFDMSLNIQFVMAGLLGGLGTLVGPLLGAGVLQLLSELIWSNFLQVHLAVLGLVIMLVVLFMPGGVIALLRRGVRTKGGRALWPTRS